MVVPRLTLVTGSNPEPGGAPTTPPRRPPMLRRFRKSTYRDRHGKGPGTPRSTPWWMIYDGHQ